MRRRPPPATLSALLARTAHTHADRPAVIDSKTTLSWGALAAMAQGYAAQLHGAGIGRGDRVALWLPNSADYLAMIFAVARLGAVAVHINPRFRAHELGTLLRRTAPALLVTDLNASADFADVLAAVPDSDQASLRSLLTRGATPSLRTACGLDVEPLRATDSVADSARPDDPCAIFTTTGSTGSFKLVLHGQRGIVAHSLRMAPVVGLDQTGAMWLATLPFCGIFGHCYLMMAVAGGAGIVLHDSADIDALIRRRRITHIGGTADVLAWVVASARERPHDSVRSFMAGRSPFVDNDTVFADAARLGLKPQTAYGSTEAQIYFAQPPAAWALTPGGMPTDPAARFAVRDPETGADLPENEAGALLIAGPSLFLRYEGDPDATAAAWTSDGLFRTGDRACRRGAGFELLGRQDDTMRLGGFLVDPAEIEVFLRLQPAVAEARVVAAGARGAARAVAFVVARPGQTASEPVLLEACRENIAAYKVPARIVLLDAFPVSEGANGRKIRLGELREMATALLRDA